MNFQYTQETSMRSFAQAKQLEATKTNALMKTQRSIFYVQAHTIGKSMWEFISRRVSSMRRSSDEGKITVSPSRSYVNIFRR